MKINISQQDALVFVSEANTGGLPHSFVQVPMGRANDEVETRLDWVTDWVGPALRIHLNRDGTWKAELYNVLSPNHSPL